MKRDREIGSISMASYNSSSNNCVFECKTCNRKFPSFQALGGHRASHKKPRLMMKGDRDMDEQLSHDTPPKPKTHECSICGLEFAIGQALGGHMRRHRTANLNGNIQSSTTMSNRCGSRLDSSSNRMEAGNDGVFVLDLNMTPFENYIELFKIEKDNNNVGATRKSDANHHSQPKDRDTWSRIRKKKE